MDVTRSAMPKRLNDFDQIKMTKHDMVYEAYKLLVDAFHENKMPIEEAVDEAIGWLGQYLDN